MRFVPVILIALLAVACSASSGTATTDVSSTLPASTTSADVTMTTSDGPTTSDASLGMPPEIAGFRVKDVEVGDRVLTLAIADDPSLRAQGLMGVTDLGDLDGMLFFWRHDGDPFWMKDTLIPLDIVWFNEDGTYKGRASMTPCTEDPCQTYQPEDLHFRYAIEAEPGTLDWVTEDTVITYIDD